MDKDSNSTQNPFIKNIIHHHKINSVLITSTKMRLDSDRKVNKELSTKLQSIKHENEIFLSRYNQITSSKGHDPNLIFIEDLKKYKNKGYNIKNLNNVQLFNNNLLLNEGSKSSNRCSNYNKFRSSSYSHKLISYVNKLNHLVVEKKIDDKGIIRNMMFHKKTKDYDSDSIYRSNTSREEGDLIQSRLRENRELTEYNSTLESLINQTENEDRIKPKEKKKVQIFDQKNFTTSVRRFTFKELNSQKDKEYNPIKGSSNWVLKKKNTVRNSLLSRGKNNIALMSGSGANVNKKQSNRGVNCSNFTKSTNINLKHLSPDTKEYYLKQIEKSNTYYQLKRNILCYYKYCLGYPETKAYELVENNSTSKELLHLIVNIKQNSPSHDMKIKTPMRFNETINAIEKQISHLDKNYIKRLYKTLDA